MVECGNASCSPGGATITTVDAGSDVGAWTSLAIGDDGRPVIAYDDTTAGVLQVAK
ncbi:MAG: hypothetical protein IPJ17_17885 [Holophagales bacterium]|nr:MAG: hypothetical protein IPJ17_17885 [Holophagales bacterium]